MGFLPVVQQMLQLFLLILIGFLLVRCRILPSSATAVLSKLENTVLIPALVLGVFLENLTVERLGVSGQAFAGGAVLALVSVPFALVGARVCSREPFTRNVYTYGLAFSNFGFMGNAVIGALFPDLFAEYLMFTLPFWILIYLWGVPVLLMEGGGKGQGLRSRLRAFLNPMMLAMVVGVVLGLSRCPVPGWVRTTITSTGNCMSPIAMLLTGMTVAQVDLKKVVTIPSIYAVTFLRLLVLPLLSFPVLRYVLELPTVLVVCCVSVLSMPLGLNTIVIPSAYGKDTTVPAGMTLISHLFSCVTIPLIFYLMEQWLL